MKREHSEFSYVPARHDEMYRIHDRHLAIHDRLVNWARYVSGRRGAWTTQPIFLLAKSSRQWEISPEIRTEIDTLDGHLVEKTISSLPSKNRTCIRWWYVFPFIYENKIRRGLGCTKAGLCDLVHDARDMVNNRLR